VNDWFVICIGWQTNTSRVYYELTRSNLKPHNINPSLFIKLREARATDAEIVEALSVMGIFTSFNKFIDTLEVAPEL
jgi:alkylhydroperoxidase family enzyme